MQTTDLNGTQEFPSDCWPDDTAVNGQCRSQLAWNGATWVVFDTQLAVNEYYEYYELGSAAGGLPALATSSGGDDIQNARWQDHLVEILDGGTSNVRETYLLAGSIDSAMSQCFSYSMTCGLSVGIGSGCVAIGFIGLLLSVFAPAAGKRPTVQHSTGWADAWVGSGPRRGLMLMERVVDQAVVTQLDAASRMRATTVVTLSLPDQLTLLHATTGFIASQV